MSPVVYPCPQPLAAAIGTGLPQQGDRLRAGPVVTLALTAALGCLSNADAATPIVVNTTQDPNLSFSLVGLRDAIVQANANPLSDSVITFAPAMAGKTITLHGGELDITRAVSLVGPGAGNLTISGNDASRIFHIIGPGKGGSAVEVSISGLTLTHGASPVGQGGGAIDAEGQAGVHVVESVISDSHAAVGGGIAAYASYCGFAALNLTKSVISGNSATLSGGGISTGNCIRTYIYYSTVTGNSAYDYGGGVFAGSPFYLNIAGSLISGNSVGGPASPIMGGAGIAVTNAYLGLQIWNSSVVGNIATAEGGGIAILDAVSSEATVIDSCTITGNYGYSFPGQGIASAGGTVNLVNSIVANNYSRFEGEDLAGTFASDHSLIKTKGAFATVTGPGNILGQDPLLGPLRDNGGFTLSMLPAVASPAIGNGSTALTFDQRALPRPAGTGIDIGAVERQYPEPLIFRNGFDPP
jgi:hypothetical protein